MEEEIEDKLQEIYTPYVKVKFRDFGVYDVFLTFKYGQVIAVVFYYDAHLTKERNFKNIQDKIDNEIVKSFKRY